LDRIQHLINTERIDATKSITLVDLFRAGIRFKDGVFIGDRFSKFLTTPIVLYATKFSAAAIARIEKIGGKAIAIHHNKLGIRALLKPHRFLRPIRLAAPNTNKDLLYYWSHKNRGYLHKEMLDFMSNDPWVDLKRYVIAKRAYLPEQIEKLKAAGHDVSDLPVTDNRLNKF
jgi:hypothetical protein